MTTNVCGDDKGTEMNIGSEDDVQGTFRVLGIVFPSLWPMI
jgi:hypothetical protein